MSTNLYFGTAGWSYKDWNGYFYPERFPSGIDRLTYYSEYFDTVEINSSFYRIPPAKFADGWIKKVETNSSFKFTLKLWQGFTHALEYPGQNDISDFNSVAKTLIAADKLGAILVQFPWSFRYNINNLDKIKLIIETFCYAETVIEIRHKSWERTSFFETLKSFGSNYCNIDQPVIGESISPTEVVTGNIGYVRLHGRNYKKWFDPGDKPSERYNYLYNENEIDEWVARIKKIIRKDSNTYVITNNHWQGKAAHTALKIKNKIKSQKLKIPDSLISKYKDLSDIRLNGQQSQSSLL